MTTLVKPRTLFIGLSLLCVLAIWLSLALGPVSLPLMDTLRAALRLLGVPIEAQGLEQAELILGLGLLHMLWIVRADLKEWAIYASIGALLLILRVPPVMRRIPRLIAKKPPSATKA